MCVIGKSGNFRFFFSAKYREISAIWLIRDFKVSGAGGSVCLRQFFAHYLENSGFQKMGDIYDGFQLTGKC